MTTSTTVDQTEQITDGLTLTVRRIIKATPEKVFQAWEDTNIRKQWFCPKPWYVSSITEEFRAGGSCLTVMNGPNGEEMPNPGIYLEIIPNRRIVSTDAYTTAWIPNPHMMMTMIVELEPHTEGTLFTWSAAHWDETKMKAHVDMGFFPGWTTVAAQLAEAAEKL
jgi:uncharacterized protein YndB with AHSA1/START domain